MHRIASQAAILAAIAAPFVTAQTFTSCNPMKKTCPGVPGLAQSSYSVDLTNGVPKDWSMTSGAMKKSDKGGLFQINDVKDGPTVASDFSIFFGSVEITMQAAPGAGIISTFVMESIDLDEIDLEIIGSETTQVQSNYFGKGNTTTYDRGEKHPVNSPQTGFHTYKVDWKADATNWYIDGQLVRTLNFADAVGGKNYPQTPMNIRIGDWVAGQKGNAQGTIDWAGGLADMSQAPFNMYVTKVNIVNDNPCAEYEYGDKTGDWQSIKCKSKGKTSSSSSSASASSTSAASSKSASSVSASSSSSASASSASSAIASSVSSAVSSASSASSPAAISSAPESVPSGSYNGQSGGSWGGEDQNGSHDSASKPCDEPSMVPFAPAPSANLPSIPANRTIPTYSAPAPPAPPASTTPVAPVDTTSTPSSGTTPVAPVDTTSTPASGTTPVAPVDTTSTPASGTTPVAPVDSTPSSAAALTPPTYDSATPTSLATATATVPTPAVAPTYAGGAGNGTAVAPTGTVGTGGPAAPPKPTEFNGGASKQGVNAILGLAAIAGLIAAL